MIAYNMDHSGILVSKFVCKYCLLGDLPPPPFFTPYRCEYKYI